MKKFSNEELLKETFNNLYLTLEGIDDSLDSLIEVAIKGISGKDLKKDTDTLLLIKQVNELKQKMIKEMCYIDKLL